MAISTLWFYPAALLWRIPPDVRERLKSLIEEGLGKLVIDMENVSFIDSSACAVLIFGI